MKSFLPVSAILVLLLMLTHPALTREGACQGLLLWSQTVLPTLLPFMICSNVIVALNGLRLMILPFKPFLCRFLMLSDSGCYVMLSGLLCGYPIGAKTCSEFLNQGRISLKEARYLLAISNHPSPMFVLGYAALALTCPCPASWLLSALYLPVFPISWMARRVYQIRERCPDVPDFQPTQEVFDEIMMSSVEVMVRIGGYIMLFSILAAFLRRLPGISPFWRTLCLGLVEITTGISAISQSISGRMQGLCLVAVTAFGGLSGLLQTNSVLKNAGLSLRHYVIWKLVHSALSCLIFGGCLLFFL